MEIKQFHLADNPEKSRKLLINSVLHTMLPSLSVTVLCTMVWSLSQAGPNISSGLIGAEGHGHTSGQGGRHQTCWHGLRLWRSGISYYQIVSVYVLLLIFWSEIHFISLWPKEYNLHISVKACFCHWQYSRGASIYTQRWSQQRRDPWVCQKSCRVCDHFSMYCS